MRNSKELHTTSIVRSFARKTCGESSSRLSGKVATCRSCKCAIVCEMKQVRRPVSRVLSPPVRRWMAIPLGRPLPNASRDRPGRRRGNTAAGCPACRPYLVLLPVGFAVPLPLPVARWALTPPFHPCLLAGEAGTGGLFSVALSLGSPPPAVSRHRVSVEPGLSSPRGCPAAQPSSRLTCGGLTRAPPPAGQAGRPAGRGSRDRPCRRPGPAGSGAGRPSTISARRHGDRRRIAEALQRRLDIALERPPRRRAATGRCRPRASVAQGKRRPGSILRCGRDIGMADDVARLRSPDGARGCRGKARSAPRSAPADSRADRRAD